MEGFRGSRGSAGVGGRGGGCLDLKAMAEEARLLRFADAASSPFRDAWSWPGRNLALMALSGGGVRLVDKS